MITGDKMEQSSLDTKQIHDIRPLEARWTAQNSWNSWSHKRTTVLGGPSALACCEPAAAVTAWRAPFPFRFSRGALACFFVLRGSFRFFSLLLVESRKANTSARRSEAASSHPSTPLSFTRSQSQPASSSSRTISACPPAHAMWNAVKLRLSPASMVSQPACNSFCTAPVLPIAAAWCN